MDDVYGQLRRDFRDFIDADLAASTYAKKLEAALEGAYDPDKDIVKDVRLAVDVQDLQVRCILRVGLISRAPSSTDRCTGLQCRSVPPPDS